jgi:hypothetical protein
LCNNQVRAILSTYQQLNEVKMTKLITVGDFLNHIQDLSYDNPELLNMELSGLIVYIDDMDSPISITTDEE